MTVPAISTDALEALMKKVFVENAAEPGLFWDALLRANLYVPLAEPDPKREDPDVLPMLLGQDSEGKYVVWIFTSRPAMTDYTERDLRFLELPALTLLNRIKDFVHDKVLIGPDGLTLSLHKELVDSLAAGTVPEAPRNEIRNIPKDARVYVGAPSEPPTAMEELLRGTFEHQEEVLDASFIQISDDAGPRLLLGLRLKVESREELRRIASIVAQAAEGVLGRGESMDITLIDGSLKEAFEKYGRSFFHREP